MNDKGKRILINLGCGPDVQKSDWIDCDGSWNVLIGKLPYSIRIVSRTIASAMGMSRTEWPAHVRFMNLRTRLPFDDNSVDAVYASHVWEHLSRIDAERATRECFRVLRPNGMLRLVIPDLLSFCRRYVSSNESNASDQFMELMNLCDRGERHSLLNMMYTRVTGFHNHKWMYDGRSLSRMMIEAGFVEVNEKKCFESTIPEIKQVERAGRVSPEAGIALEAEKPTIRITVA